MKFLSFLIFIIFILPLNIFAQNKVIKACSDNRGEYPNINFVKGKTFGIWVDIINEALIRLKIDNEKHNYSLSITGIPITKCQSELIKGKYDVMITSSYNTRRASFFYFPPGSDKENKPCSSPFKFACNGFVVISPKKVNNEDNKYVFNGKIENLPDLVFIDKGRMIMGDLEEKGIVPEVSEKIDVSINRMLKEGGVAITSVHTGITMLQDAKYSDKITLQKIPLSITSYYIPFSKKSKFTEEERLSFWKSISAVSNDKTFLAKINNQYK
ncbi:hypothetical protein [Fluviispira sanaruensis]|uniref:Solute-binding protein family 3/N-terminal domain-containing protein n=1 Tax=Fluviispira sanaruensis TaxID=2493639 RepID=A0A4P2VGC9_FLUSA|nr:hypothetical protein [Fluviispira sanaruensis]BBH51796.1 hypothetical protein JCM31447_02160 [Fluviispira sanaruensis]